MPRLSRIDDLIRPEYYYLESGDACFFLREYTSRRDYRFSETNNLISNLKKSPLTRGTAQWPYKERAIDRLARELSEALGQRWLTESNFVPIPPSKTPDDPEYDDRMTRLLRQLAPNCDVRELIYQTESTEAAHTSTRTRRPEVIAENYRVDRSELRPTPRFITLVDDVVTTGAHFKAAVSVLRRHLPTTPISGVFLARAVRLEEEDE